jgi:Fur family transcriptional regulator, ferric uptake regulator
MSCERRFQNELHQRGLRMTSQREAILSVLHGFGTTVTAEEVHREAVRLNRTVELSTVYRTLDLLQSVGLVSAVGQEGKLRRFLYVGQEQPHFHLRCVACGEVQGVDAAEMAALASRLKSKRGFALNVSQATLPGLCRGCR